MGRVDGWVSDVWYARNENGSPRGGLEEQSSIHPCPDKDTAIPIHHPFFLSISTFLHLFLLPPSSSSLLRKKQSENLFSRGLTKAFHQPQKEKGNTNNNKTCSFFINKYPRGAFSKHICTNTQAICNIYIYIHNGFAFFTCFVLSCLVYISTSPPF